jgi:microsomal dipeptidase-like Zn-dependent dipeptidase
MLIFDGHLDLAMNAIDWNRDLRQPIDQIRARESGMSDKPDRGRGTVCFPEMRRGGIGLCIATQIARYVKPSNPLPGWHSPEQAWAATQGQLAWYRAMEEAGELVQVRNGAQLERHLDRWSSASTSHPQPIGYVLSLEGADSLVTVATALDAWMMIPGWERGRTRPDLVGLQLAKAVDHVDHVCQIAGNSRHAAIGSDLDGGFGREQCPLDLESIADLQRVPELLTSRGYKQEDIQLVAHGNLVRFLRDAWRVKS